MDLQHDPRTKQQIKDLLYSYLYDPVERKYQQKLKSLIQRNSLALNKPEECFSYRGNIYSLELSRIPRKVARLVPALHPEMDQYLADLKQLNEKELPYVLGFITQVLNASNDLQDYLRVLPESIHRPIEELIASCGCRTAQLPPETVEQLKARNAESIAMMKQRLVLNLLE